MFREFVNPYLHHIDIIILLVYFTGILIHGYLAGRGKDTTESYFLAGRRLPWFLIGFSLYSSNMSGASFIGLMGASYAHGMVVFNYEWTATLVLIFFAFFMAPYFIRSKINTIPGFLEKRFDVRSRRTFSAFTILAIIFIDTAGALYAGGFVITLVFPQMSLLEAVAILGVLAGVYTILGGLSAVVMTDTVQGILLILGAAAVFIIGLDKVGGWENLTSSVSGDTMDMIRSTDDSFLPWPGIFGVILLGFYYWTINQFIVQRTLGARSLDHARKGALFAGLLKLPNLFIMILPGIIGIALFPALEKPDLVFPKLTLELLPVGFRGLVITALVAAIMSSLDSALNAASSLITLDFIKPLSPKTTERVLVRWGRWLTAVIMVISIIYAPMIARFETLFQYFQSALAYVVPPLVAVFLAGIFIKRINATASFFALLASIIFGVPLFVLKEVTNTWQQSGLPDIHYTYMAGILFFVAILFMILLSVSGKRPQLEKLEFTFRKDWIQNDTTKKWYLDYRWQSLLLFLLMVIVIIIFR